MPNLSDAQLEDLAHSFHDLAFAVGQVRLDALSRGSTLTDPGMIYLKNLLLQLTDLASRFALQSAQVTLSDVDQALNVIRAATDKAGLTLQHLEDVEKGIAIGAAALALGAAIFTMDMNAIAVSAQGLWKVAS